MSVMNLITQWFARFKQRLARARFRAELDYLLKIQWGPVDFYLPWFEAQLAKIQATPVWYRRVREQTLATQFGNVDQFCLMLESFAYAVRDNEYLSTLQKNLQPIHLITLFDYLQTNSGAVPDIHVVFAKQFALLKDIENELERCRTDALKVSNYEYYNRYYATLQNELHDFWLLCLQAEHD